MRIDHQPSRRFAAPERDQALRPFAGQLTPASGVLLDLEWDTRHRISAILGLRWEHSALDATPAANHGAIT